MRKFFVFQIILFFCHHIVYSQAYVWEGINGGNPNGIVRSLAVYDGKLIVGGVFNQIDGGEFNLVAAYDGTEWKKMGNGIKGSVSGVFPDFFSPLHRRFCRISKRFVCLWAV